MVNTIVGLSARDIRFPTSDHLVGSDATNPDPDYSAVYITLETANGDVGYALIFTIGRGTDIGCRAVESMRHLVIGRDLDGITGDLGSFCASLMGESQLRWLGPEKGVMHMATGGIVNAVWDLWARRERKPVWRLAADLSPEQFVNCLNLRYVSDVLRRDEALAIVQANEATKHDRVRQMAAQGYPAYTTSPGWLGYDDDKLAALCAEAIADGYRAIKLKVGRNVDDDERRCRIARDVIGPDVQLLIDANQCWEVAEAIEWLQRLAPFSPLFIEEPTSPDDILGHRKIRDGIHGMKVATGEHCHNRVMFKQFIEGNAIDIVQVDACRLAGMNEMLTVAMIAAKYGKPVWPHAGGVGLSEYVQHLSMIDFVRISATTEGRMAEFVDHLHEHFEDPCRVANGYYLAPTQPGYSIKMKDTSLATYAFPDGPEWRRRHGR